MGTDNKENLSVRAKLVRDLVANFNKNELLKTKFREDKRGFSEFDKQFKYPDTYTATKFYLKNFNMELLQKKDSANDWVLLQLHGGGYVGPFKNSYRLMAKIYCDVGNGMDVLSIDYRVAPQNPYPAALEDALEAYEWLISRGYSEDRIIFGGDSAGGGLALCLCHYLKDNNRKLPAGVVTMSPWTDLAATGKSYDDNYEIDPIFGNTRQSLIYDSPYIGDANVESPYISPMYGDFTGFPPMLIQVGTHEMLYSDSFTVAEKAKKQGVKVRFSEYEGMFHVFQMAGKLMPESANAWNEVGLFINLIMNKKLEDLNSEFEEKKKLRVALAQYNIRWEDKEANYKQLVDMLTAMKNSPMDLLLLPEMSLTGFSMNTEATREDETEIIEKIGNLSEKYSINIGIGWVKGDADGLCENHYSVISPSKKMLSDYEKIHPFSYSGEDKFFKGGDHLSIFKLNDMSIGTAICYDLRFPEIFQIMSDEAEMIVVPANWPSSRVKHWKKLLCARAIENQAYIAGINCIGDMNGQLYPGESAIYNPDGKKVKATETISVNDSCQIFIYDIENNIGKIRSAFPVKADRRSGLYAKLEI